MKLTIETLNVGGKMTIKLYGEPAQVVTQQEVFFFETIRRVIPNIVEFTAAQFGVEASKVKSEPSIIKPLGEG